jgi:copper resistance protein B
MTIMKKQLIALLSFGLSFNVVAGGMNDDPLISKVMISQFEKRFTDGADPLVLEGQGWIGKDLHKLWIKIDAERVSGENEEFEIQALYSRAIFPFWDLQMGWRHDSRPTPNRDWAVIGFQGLSPYWFEIDAAFFVGEKGRTALRLEAEYEVLFTQRLIMTPEIEINAHGRTDAELGIGSGLSDAELGLRLRYEIRREFSPYVGVNWTSTFGNTADFARAAGAERSDTQFVIGVRGWF